MNIINSLILFIIIAMIFICIGTVLYFAYGRKKRKREFYTITPFEAHGDRLVYKPYQT